MKKFNKQLGFTLIELLLVIIILGIVAVIAVPKYIDLKNSSKMSSLLTIKATMQDATTLTYSKSAIKGNHKLKAGASVYVDINGTLVAIKYGTPLANYATARGSWDTLISLDYNVFSTTMIGGHYVIYYKENSIPTTLNDKCIVHYQQANKINNPPKIEVEAC